MLSLTDKPALLSSLKAAVARSVSSASVFIASAAFSIADTSCSPSSDSSESPESFLLAGAGEKDGAGTASLFG